MHAAEPQHEDAVGDGLEVARLVADEDDGVPALAQLLDEVEHLGRLPDAERRRRLVEDEHARRPEEGARDRHDLPLAARERAHRLPHGRDGRGELVEQAPRLALHRDLVEERPVEDLLPEEHVLDDVEVVDERELLEHRRDPVLARGRRRVEHDGRAVEQHLARVGAERARDDARERRLAGAVVAHDGEDLVLAHLDVDVDERPDAAEALGDPAQGQDGGAHGAASRRPASTHAST